MLENQSICTGSELLWLGYSQMRHNLSNACKLSQLKDKFTGAWKTFGDISLCYSKCAGVDKVSKIAPTCRFHGNLIRKRFEPYLISWTVMTLGGILREGESVMLWQMANKLMTSHRHSSFSLLTRNILTQPDVVVELFQLKAVLFQHFQWNRPIPKLKRTPPNQIPLIA